jgi:hypothetical protein
MNWYDDDDDGPSCSDSDSDSDSDSSSLSSDYEDMGEPEAADTVRDSDDD